MEASIPSVRHKKLLIFCDGAQSELESYFSRMSEDPDEGEKEMHPFGLSPPFSPNADRASNIVRLSRSIEALSRDNIYQLVIYQSITIRSDNPDPRLSTDAFGVAIAVKIWEIYHHIAHNYSPGDQIYLFGISHGAFIARKLANLLDALGILDTEQMKSFFRRWRDSNQLQTSRPGPPVKIEFLGLWDSAELNLENGSKELVDLLGVKDNILPDCVKRVRYAMAYHETSEAPATDTSFRVSGDDQRVAQVWFPGTRRDIGKACKFHQIFDISLLWMAGEIQDAGIELNTSYLNAVISRAAGTSLEVHGTTPQKEWDSEKATKLWEIEGRGEQFQTSMSDPSTYCHRSMWAPLVRSSEQYPTDSQECYYPAYWTQPVLPAPLDKLRELNDLERHFWAERWEHTIPDPKKSKQPFGCGIQKASGASQIEPATSLLYTTQPIVEDTVESALDDPKEPSIEEEIDTKPAYIDPDQNQKMPKEAENTPHPEIDTKSTDKK